jgi:hypothetical protein
MIWRTAFVTIDGPSYPAKVRTDVNWNGWAVPKFDLETARVIAREVNKTSLTELADTGTTEQLIILEKPANFGNAPFFMVINPASLAEGSAAEVYHADEDGMYGLGAFEWPWSRLRAVPAYGWSSHLTVQGLGDDSKGAFLCAECNRAMGSPLPAQTIPSPGYQCGSCSKDL